MTTTVRPILKAAPQSILAPGPDHSTLDRIPTLELELTDWAMLHCLEALESMVDRCEDLGWCLKCLGGLFRRRAKADPAWLFDVARRRPREVIALGPYVKSIAFGEVEFPGRLGWAGWCAALKAADELF